MTVFIRKLNFNKTLSDIFIMDMTIDELLNLIKTVVLSKEVLGTTVIIILILNMVFYIVSYKKHPVKKRKKRPAGSFSLPKTSSTPTTSSSVDNSANATGGGNVSYDA